MELNPEQLAGQLSRHLAPFYLLAGEELLRQQQALDLLLAQARLQGFGDRIRIDGEQSSADWQPLTELGQPSLFADKTLLQIDFMTGKISAQAQKILQSLPTPGSDDLLILRVNLPERKVKDSAWFKALSPAPILVSCPIVNREQLPQWLARRAQHLQLKLTTDALHLLADRLEGNLLAAAQELDKLKLSYDSALIDVDIIEASVANNARFDIFRLVDAFTSNNSWRALTILHQLRAEAQEPVLILWALQREFRLLAQLQEALQKGSAWQQLCQQHRLWPARAKSLHQCLHRTPSTAWPRLLVECQRLDAQIKGQLTDGVPLWPAFESLLLTACGQPSLASHL